MERKNDSLRRLFEVMGKIDSTYVDKNDDVDVDVAQDDASLYNDDEVDTNDKKNNEEPVQLSNIVKDPIYQKIGNVKAVRDYPDFNVKIPKDSNIGAINNPGTQTLTGGEMDDDVYFMGEQYVDTYANLEKVAISNVNVSSSIDATLGQFNATRDNALRYGGREDGKDISAYIPGGSLSNDKANTPNNYALMVCLNLFRSHEIGTYARITSLGDLCNYINQNSSITFKAKNDITKFNLFLEEIRNNRQALNFGNEFDKKLASITEEEFKDVKSKIDNIKNNQLDSFKRPGISNAQAKYMLISPITSNFKETSTLPELIGMFNLFPKNIKKLRSASYVNYITHGAKNTMNATNNIRNFVFDSGAIKKETILFNYKGKTYPIIFNDTLDDPLTNLGIEELSSKAAYIMASALDLNNKNASIAGEDRTKFDEIFLNHVGKKTNDSIEGKVTDYVGKKTNDSIAYTVMDYVVNFVRATILKDSSINYSSTTGIRLVYHENIAKYISLIKDFNSRYQTIDNETALSVIPITAFFEDNDGIEYLNNLKNNSNDNRTKEIISEILSAVSEKTGNIKTAYRLVKKDDGDYGVFSANKEGKYIIEQTDRMTLFELMSGVLNSGDNSSQAKLLKDITEKFPNIKVNAEWNNDNDGNEDEELKKFIGKKSIDIVLDDRILIEYQGEQHYTPACCRGLDPDITGLGKSDLNTIRASRGRAAKYITMSLLPGYEQGIGAIRNKLASNECGNFLTKSSFVERMESLVNEIVYYIKEKYNKDSRTITKVDFLKYAWEYLGLFVEGNVFIDEEVDIPYKDEKGEKVVNKWKQWGVVTSLTSRRRWKQELIVYLQQAADKQKYIYFKEKGYDFFYVCPPGRGITKQLIKEHDKVKHITDFTSFLNGEDEIKNIKDYVKDEDYMVAEGILKLGGELRPEFMASNFTFRGSESGDISKMTWEIPEGTSLGDFGNQDTLLETIKNIIKIKDKNKNKKGGA